MYHEGLTVGWSISWQKLNHEEKAHYKQTFVTYFTKSTNEGKNPGKFKRHCTPVTAGLVIDRRHVGDDETKWKNVF